MMEFSFAMNQVGAAFLSRKSASIHKGFTLQWNLWEPRLAQSTQFYGAVHARDGVLLTLKASVGSVEMFPSHIFLLDASPALRSFPILSAL